MRDRAEVACKAHNLEVGGSNPPPATKKYRNTRFNLIDRRINKRCPEVKILSFLNSQVVFGDIW